MLPQFRGVSQNFIGKTNRSGTVHLSELHHRLATTLPGLTAREVCVTGQRKIYGCYDTV
jgi:hypothetical protein